MKKYKFFLLLLPIIIFLYFLLSIPIYSGDVKNHLAWSESILAQGTFNFYNREFINYAFPNYPPLAMLLFALSLKLYQLTVWLILILNNLIALFPSKLVFFFQWENVEIAFLKFPALLGNLLVALSMLMITQLPRETKFKYKQWWWLLFIANPAIIYLSVIWGQFDVLPVGLYLVGLVLLLKKKLYWASLTIGLSLLTKQTILIFYPVFLYLVFKEYQIKKTILSILIVLASFYISYLPFHSPSLTWPIGLYKQNFELVAHSTSENALNLWGVLYNFQRHPDGEYFGLFQLQTWGYVLFILSILPLLFVFFKRGVELRNIFSFLYLISLLDFFFLTRMHERYLAPALVLSYFLLLFGRRYGVNALYLTLIYFLNLYRGLLQPNIGIFNSLVFNSTFLDLLVAGYGLLIIYNYYLYFKIK